MIGYPALVNECRVNHGTWAATDRNSQERDETEEQDEDTAQVGYAPLRQDVASLVVLTIPPGVRIVDVIVFLDVG